MIAISKSSGLTLSVLSLPQNMLVPGCARIRDHISNEMTILIGCDSTSSSVLAWNLVTDEIVAADYACPNEAVGGTFYPFKFKELDDQNIAVVNLNNPGAYTFNMAQGFAESFVDIAAKLKGDSAVTPPGLYDCSEFAA